jgi:predicted CXXCH cytochrome family protein
MLLNLTFPGKGIKAMKRPLIWAAVALFIGVMFWGARPALAGGPPEQTANNQECLACHSRPNLTYQFPTGETWSVHVDPETYQSSVHGQEGVVCTDCHKDITGYPHPALEANNSRFYQLEHYQVCQDCHQEVYEDSLDSMHARKIASGDWDAAVCTDCHGAHDTTPAGKPRTKIPETCSKCHSTIYNEYRDSVHGQALVNENNTDVPTCVTCHTAHTQEDPRTASFRLNSPNLCASCHADEALMKKYDVSTHVFDTYVADFHGTTVTLFERQSPDLPTNKAVCYDCHGVHNMKRADDPESQVFRENLLKTCQRCHPDATENFSATWLSHYEPNLQKYPMVYLVNLFYDIFIPAIIGFMGVVVVLDLSSRVFRHTKPTPPGTQERND